jgi:hypothetical protein
LSYISRLRFFGCGQFGSGRLTRAVKSTEGIIYQYDEVGNLLSVIREATTASPPVLQAVNPDVLFIGSTNTVLITGLNLITTKEVKSANPSLGIKILTVTDKSIKAEIAVSSAASPGTATITVTTSYGSANIAVTLSSSNLTFSPGQITLTPGGIGNITASIFPSIGRDVTIAINNSDSTIISVPQSLIIPSHGVATFTVNAIKTGSTFVKSGSSATFVLVKNPETIADFISRAGPVSVYIESPMGNSTTSARPVSVYVDQPMGNSTTSARPVSVYVDQPLGNSTTSARPVSVYVDQPMGNSTTSARPVSVYVDQPMGNSTTSALPVSVYIDQPMGNSTVMSLPVSAKISP